MSSDVEPSDADLVARCLAAPGAGRHASFRALYERHAGLAHRYLTALVGADSAGDALQETFLRAHRDLARFDRARPFRPWLLGIARHVAQDELRRRARRPQPGPLAAEPADPRGEERPAREAARQEASHLVWEAVAELPPEAREVFLLRQVEQLSFAEAAAAADCSLRTAKSRMRAAMDHLAAALRRRGVTGGAP